MDEFGDVIFEDDLMSEMQELIFKTAVEKGWWEGEPNIPEKLMLIVSEASEALEDYRNGKDLTETTYTNGKPEGFPTELSDIVIRVLDLAGYLGIDMASAIAEKHNFNITRSYKHGGKIC